MSTEEDLISELLRGQSRIISVDSPNGVSTDDIIRLVCRVVQPNTIYSSVTILAQSKSRAEALTRGLVLEDKVSIVPLASFLSPLDDPAATTVPFSPKPSVSSASQHLVVIDQAENLMAACRFAYSADIDLSDLLAPHPSLSSDPRHQTPIKRFMEFLLFRQHPSEASYLHSCEVADMMLASGLDFWASEFLSSPTTIKPASLHLTLRILATMTRILTESPSSYSCELRPLRIRFFCLDPFLAIQQKLWKNILLIGPCDLSPLSFFLSPPPRDLLQKSIFCKGAELESSFRQGDAPVILLGMEAVNVEVSHLGKQIIKIDFSDSPRLFRQGSDVPSEFDLFILNLPGFPKCEIRAVNQADKIRRLVRSRNESCGNSGCELVDRIALEKVLMMLGSKAQRIFFFMDPANVHGVLPEWVLGREQWDQETRQGVMDQVVGSLSEDKPVAEKTVSPYDETLRLLGRVPRPLVVSRLKRNRLV